jgi:hypothetical protein
MARYFINLFCRWQLPEFVLARMLNEFHRYAVNLLQISSEKMSRRGKKRPAIYLLTDKKGTHTLASKRNSQKLWFSLAK